ncbi:DUF1801 domain-containing protein [Sediminibacterium sp. TEGAF015]|uniref:DUF1801 domain-containing protein n=1 Tax=Sediminibacterium sp. TEGAF015 TaxID=575378 RepID=UPI0021FE7FA7|nr:DUF1801 domain-containing protein [Sediminibacterium sp. TEGAF015]BDQ11883.1 hypothetical protein TEGAF0_11000 [Sediminibacterium sp. TEGAF015]
MISGAKTVKEYLKQIPDEQKEVFSQIRDAITGNLPAGFEECISYGMIGYVVPHSLYKDGYHCDPKLPLPFMALAAQKNFIAFYHMGIYAQPSLLEWFTQAYKMATPTKLDMGKSCIRFKKTAQVPNALIGELVQKMTPEEWISIYENLYKNNRKKK